MNDRAHITEIAEPADQDAVAKIVRSAAAGGTPVYILGGGTEANNGWKPERPGIGLSLAKLNQVIDHAADDLTITVEAGVTIAELRKCLAAKRQRLPIDVRRADRGTVGGAVAVNAAGPRRYAYGSMRDYVLGLNAVDGMGGRFSGGGRVVKNAAGYNMCRLLAGSRGTLAVLTQATLMVRPVCEASEFFVCDVPDFAVAERLLAGLVRSKSQPVAVEFVAGRPREGEQPLGAVLSGNIGRLYVGFEGPAAEVDWMIEQLRVEWSDAGANAPMRVPTARAEALWQWLADSPTGAQFHTLPSQTIATIAELVESHPDASVQAHAGDGVVCTSLHLHNDEDRDDDDGKLAPALRVMQSIKDRFDPQNILNPGRLVFR